ncbi:ANTAR domain-containing protein [Amycolatopsis acidiphila]|uniref:ANTAR domain-containing protein n=1 Tax=Amycolatopsis acidiphila TaxID=715473 RepID=A0A558ACK9_9PSEU|nr:ANTAR domain-containing protein [Amycolatopsis acidiphila]TVT22009.1 ANTAR domain-containing protein [Amycolatopsis acidiphila]UIJ63675.1 ANTAR domain-containing protein [Amycolatopsis acidiphila]GHG67527.1 hypothetical protein GCM10017788_26470 [Amycolatopsis acidiphila]
MTSEQEWTADRTRFARDGQGDLAWEGPLARQFDALGELLLTGITVAEVLDRVVGAAKALVSPADMVSVTLRAPSGIYTTPVRTDKLADELDQLQYTHDEGPCVEATRTPGAAVVEVPDLTANSPWSRWGPAATRAGVHSVFAVGLFPTNAPPRLGALNFYAFRPYGLDGIDRQLAILLAGYAATALTATEAVTAAELEAAQLREALRSRDVIGQAKGILMQRQGIGADEAFDILRRTSQDLNVKLAEVAAMLVRRRNEI